jgi:DNA polymerase/3'-5' exonuclease PolX
MTPQPPFNLRCLTRLTDNDISIKLESCSSPNNARVVLALLNEANDLFRTKSRSDIVRGAAYLKAADSVALQSRDVTACTKRELMAMQSIGESIATRIIEIITYLNR